MFYSPILTAISSSGMLIVALNAELAKSPAIKGRSRLLSWPGDYQGEEKNNVNKKFRNSEGSQENILLSS